MGRKPRLYPPETRRLVEGNLLCPSCGNTTAFAMDLKLRHRVHAGAGGLEVALDEAPTRKLTQALSKNLHRVLDKGFDEDRPRIACANCGEADFVDLLERVMDTCWQSGCPGCWYCGQYIEKEELIEACTDCIVEKNGAITLEDCDYACPNADEGLEGVRAHYGITLEEIKENLGYTAESPA